MHAPSLTGRRSSFRALSRVVVAALALQFLGCASALMPESGGMEFAAERAAASEATVPSLTHIAPQGPGAVFATPEAAAVDALAYSYLTSRRAIASERRARGGAIVSVEGGFSYAEPSVARTVSATTLRYRLQPTDVAHFRHDPRRAFGLSTTRSLDRHTRRFVDRRDPMNRPFFYMTPERFVRVYTGAEVGEQTLARVRYGVRRDAAALDVHVFDALASVWSAEGQPLALAPRASEAAR